MRNSALFALSLLSSALCFAAEDYPSKPVRVIVPFAPGGTSDLTARVISQQLSEQLGKSFVVDNRAGASGAIGNSIVARAAPDGYTILLVDTTLTIIPSLFKSLPFDVTRDFTPITQIIGNPNVLVVHPSIKAASAKDFIASAQENPGKLNYGSAGLGSITHLSGELFNRAAKIKITHIPYKGAGEAIASVLGGQVEILITGISTVIPHVESRKLRALAVTTDGKRSAAMPDVPSMQEAGLPGMAIYAWYGLSGPTGISKAVAHKLHSEVVKALALPIVRDRFQGSELVGSSPGQFTVHTRNELQRWADVIKSAGITLD